MVLFLIFLKSVYMVFRPKRYKLFSQFFLHLDKLNHVPETKYLGYLLTLYSPQLFLNILEFFCTWFLLN